MTVIQRAFLKRNLVALGLVGRARISEGCRNSRDLGPDGVAVEELRGRAPVLLRGVAPLQQCRDEGWIREVAFAVGLLD